MKQISQSGSAIIWVLMAVILFAAVGVALSYNSRTSTGIISGEQARAYAQQIIAYGNELKAATKRISLRGFSDGEISFENTLYVSASNAPTFTSSHSNCASESCKIFSPSGGGLTPMRIPAAAATTETLTQPNQAGEVRFLSLSFVGAGTSQNDIVMRVIFLDKNVCMKLNEILGVTAAGELPPNDDVTGWSNDIKTYGGTGVLGDQDTRIIGKSAACAKWVGGGQGEAEYHYYQVLLAR